MPPRRMLAIVGIAAGACAYLAATFDARWPVALLVLVCMAFGATAIGWNGVQLSEVARQSPDGQAAAMTGASGFIGFGGVVVGPTVFALLASATGGYRAGFAVFGSASLLCGLALLRTRKATGVEGPPG
jgi:MFS family permease